MVSEQGSQFVPSWPRIEAVARADGTGEVVVDGTSYPIAEPSLDQARIAIIRQVTATAEQLGRPVRVATNGPDGYWPLIVHPGGHVAADTDPEPGGVGARQDGPPAEQSAAEPGVPTLPPRAEYGDPPVPRSPRTALRQPPQSDPETTAVEPVTEPDPAASQPSEATAAPSTEAEWSTEPEWSTEAERAGGPERSPGPDTAAGSGDDPARWDQDSEDDSLIGELLAGDPPREDSAVEVVDKPRLDWRSIWEPSDRWNLRRTKKEDLPKLRFHQTVQLPAEGPADGGPSRTQPEGTPMSQSDSPAAAGSPDPGSSADPADSPGPGVSADQPAGSPHPTVDGTAVPEDRAASGMTGGVPTATPGWERTDGRTDADRPQPGATTAGVSGSGLSGQSPTSAPSPAGRASGGAQGGRPTDPTGLNPAASVHQSVGGGEPRQAPRSEPQQAVAYDPSGPVGRFGQPPSPGGAAPQPSQSSAGPSQPPASSAVPDAPETPQQRQSFLVQESAEEPASRGFRGFLTRAGIKVAPSELERSERADMMAVSQHWPGPRTIAIVNGKGGAGKALAVTEPVLTPSGYRPIGTLAVGDEVYGRDGRPHAVLGVYPQGERELFRVTFSDGTSVLADADHLWEVEAVGDRDRVPARVGAAAPSPIDQHRPAVGTRVMTTDQLRVAGLRSFDPDRGWGPSFLVRNTDPVQFPRTETALDPYRLGQLLGDSSLPVEPFRPELVGLGLYGSTRDQAFIPRAYKLGDIATRTAVLQGLLDSAGTSEPGPAASFCSTSRRLAEDVTFVAETLGCLARIIERPSGADTHRTDRRLGTASWTVRITAPAGLDLFRSERTTADPGQGPARRGIDSIEPAGRGEAVCIAVDADDHLFLTRSCIPTHNTPSTIMLSAVFALFGGAGVVAWDNNQTRGTLGWRTEQGAHDATLLDLLPEVPRLLSTGAQAADLAHYVHHQTRDRFDVLRSQPMVLAHEQRIEPRDVDAIHAVLGKYYRLIFIDSGNDESDPMWLRMIDHADQLVVATTTRNDHAEAGALLLEALAARDERSARLAQNAVAIVTQADSNATAADVRRVTNGYQSLTRATVGIPFDPGMVDGLLLFGQLKPETRRAWLAAGAAVAKGL